MRTTSRDDRRRRLLDDPNDKAHGTPYGYRLGCRCERCRKADREYHREYERKATEKRLSQLKADREKAAQQREDEFRAFPKPNPVKAEKRAKAAASKAKQAAKAREPIPTNEYDRANMAGYSVSFDPPRCAVCGRVSPLNSHHVVFRSHGGTDGPTITLCGEGNNAKDADGRWYCHGLAHHGRLFFRYVAVPIDAADFNRGEIPGHTVAHGGGHWEYLKTDEPTKIDDAMSAGGWRRL